MAISQGLKSDVFPLLNSIFSFFLFVGTSVPQTTGNFIHYFYIFVVLGCVSFHTSSVYLKIKNIF